MLPTTFQFKLEDFEASWDDEPSAAQEPKQPVVNESKTELESEKPDKEAAESVEVIKESVEEATEPVVKPIEETKEPVEVVAKPEESAEEPQPVKESEKSETSIEQSLEPKESVENTETKLQAEATEPLKFEESETTVPAEEDWGSDNWEEAEESKLTPSTIPTPIFLQVTPSLTETSHLFWEMIEVASLLLDRVENLKEAVTALRACLQLFPTRLDVTSFFIQRVLTILNEKEVSETDLNSLTQFLCDYGTSNVYLSHCISDYCSEHLTALHQEKSSLKRQHQLLVTLAALYQTKQEDYIVYSIIDTYFSAFGVADPSTEFIAFYLTHLVELLQKLELSHLRLILSVCGMNVICQTAPHISLFDKNALISLVQLGAILYGKTENKGKIVDLEIRLLALALRRSLVLQPTNTSKAKEDPVLVKVNGMIGKILFLIARVNPEELKAVMSTLSTESVTDLQNQLRRTVQLKQSESNAARRRNATRMPVKLDASKFEE